MAGFVTVRDALKELFRQIDAACRRPNAPIATGFSELDQVTGGLPRGVVLVCAATRQPVTQFLSALVGHAAAGQEPAAALIASTAGDAVQVARFLLAQRVRTSEQAILRGDFRDGAEMSALSASASELAEVPIAIASLGPAPTLERFDEVCRDWFDAQGARSERRLITIDSIDDLSLLTSARAWTNTALAACLSELADLGTTVVAGSTAFDAQQHSVWSSWAGYKDTAIGDAADLILWLETTDEPTPGRAYLLKHLVGETGICSLARGQETRS